MDRTQKYLMAAVIGGLSIISVVSTEAQTAVEAAKVSDESETAPAPDNGYKAEQSPAERWGALMVYLRTEAKRWDVESYSGQEVSIDGVFLREKDGLLEFKCDEFIACQVLPPEGWDPTGVEPLSKMGVLGKISAIDLNNQKITIEASSIKMITAEEKVSPESLPRSLL